MVSRIGSWALGTRMVARTMGSFSIETLARVHISRTSGKPLLIVLDLVKKLASTCDEVLFNWLGGLYTPSTMHLHQRLTQVMLSFHLFLLLVFADADIALAAILAGVIASGRDRALILLSKAMQLLGLGVHLRHDRSLDSLDIWLCVKLQAR